MQVLSSIVASAVKDSQIRAAMDDQIATYLNDAGACERIQKTCIPYCYTRHTSRERPFKMSHRGRIYMRQKRST